MSDIDAEAPRAPARRPRGGIAAIAVVLAFLLTVSWVRQGREAQVSEARRDRLAALVVERQRRADAMERELNQLRARAQRLATRPGPAASLQAQIERLRAFAGTAAVRGPAVTIEVADSPEADQEGTPDFRIVDTDLQLVVNALWAAGAEAISINGQRIVSTSAIRSAGQTILVNYKVLTSPYTVTAIGEPNALQARFEQSQIAEQFRTWTQVYRLSIRINSVKAATVPAYAGSVRPRHAQSVE